MCPGDWPCLTGVEWGGAPGASIKSINLPVADSGAESWVELNWEVPAEELF